MLYSQDRGHAYRVRLSLLLLAFCWWLGANAHWSRAQGIPRQQALPPRTIILPQRAVMREQATLAVIDAAGRLLPGVTLEISSEQKHAGSAGSPSENMGTSLNPPQKVTTDSTGRALFMAPGIPGPFVAKISGTGLAAGSVAVAQGEMNGHLAPAAGESSALTVNSYPHVLAIRDRFAIAGKGFHGAADLNHVFLGGQTCLVIAASPVSLVVLPGPHVLAGATRLRVKVDGYEAGRLPVTAILLEFSGPERAPSPGGDGKLILHVHGTTDPVAVEVHNGSPKVIQLLSSHSVRLKTSGGEENIAPVELKFLSLGDYLISARLVGADSANPPRGN